MIIALGIEWVIWRIRTLGVGRMRVRLIKKKGIKSTYKFKFEIIS